MPAPGYRLVAVEAPAGLQVAKPGHERRGKGGRAGHRTGAFGEQRPQGRLQSSGQRHGSSAVRSADGASVRARSVGRRRRATVEGDRAFPLATSSGRFLRPSRPRRGMGRRAIPRPGGVDRVSDEGRLDLGEHLVVDIDHSGSSVVDRTATRVVASETEAEDRSEHWRGFHGDLSQFDGCDAVVGDVWPCPAGNTRPALPPRSAWSAQSESPT